MLDPRKGIIYTTSRNTIVIKTCTIWNSKAITEIISQRCHIDPLFVRRDPKNDYAHMVTLVNHWDAQKLLNTDFYDDLSAHRWIPKYKRKQKIEKIEQIEIDPTKEIQKLITLLEQRKDTIDSKSTHRQDNEEERSKKEQSEKLKLEGNSLFAQKDFQGALQKYKEAVKVDNNNVIAYSNQVQAYIELRKWEKALEYSFNLEEKYSNLEERLTKAQLSKVYYRRAFIFNETKEFDVALNCILAAKAYEENVQIDRLRDIIISRLPKEPQKNTKNKRKRDFN